MDHALASWLMLDDHGDLSPFPVQPPDWMRDAACLGMPVEWWFPSRGASADAGLEVCERCPVRVQCGDYALEHRLEDGTWGGLSAAARAPAIADQPPAPEQARPCSCGCGLPAPPRGRGKMRSTCRGRLYRERQGGRAA